MFLAQRFIEILVNGILSQSIGIYFKKVSLALFFLLSFHKSAEEVAIGSSYRFLFLFFYAWICTVVHIDLTIVGTSVSLHLRLLFVVVPIIGFIYTLDVDLGHSF